MALTFDRGGRFDGSTASGFPSSAAPDPRQTGLTYEPFYGLKEKPFSLTSDSRFFYQSRSHAPAFDDLFNAIRRRESLNVLTGDIGTGKTTLCRAVVQSLDRKTFSAFVPDPFASREELLKVLLTDFGVASVEDVTSGRLRTATRTELSYLLSEFLATLAPLQAFAVVLIDEAQNLSSQLLEEVRILSDAEGQLQVVLVGQLELRERLLQPDMRQVDQRVSVHCELHPLDLPGVAGYVSHRLHVAGGSADRVRFTSDAIEVIHQLSGGVPRLINRFCDRALREGYAKKEGTIDADIVELANHSSPVPMEPRRASVPPPAAMPQAVTTQAMPQVVTLRAATPQAVTPHAAMPPARPEPEPPSRPSHPLSDHVEKWLKEIETQPETPPIDRDWRDRWSAEGEAEDEPQPDRRSGIRLRIPAAPNPHRHTKVDRVRRRLTRRFFSTAVALILLLGAIVVGPATVAASLDLVSAIDDQITPPPEPVLPASPPRARFAMPQVAPAFDADVAPEEAGAATPAR